jgi:DegV family protein with EDD domain
MRVMISADSTCDLTPEIAEKHGIYIVPMCLIMRGKEHFDGQDVTNKDIFRYFEEEGKLCTTTALNPSQYLDHFKKARENCDALIHIDISSGFSSCHNNAKLAAEEIDNVYVLDSQNLSTGFGEVVLNAAIMAENGASVEEIIQSTNEIKRRVETSFVIDKLTYLHKGGRCSALAALGANLMNLKPTIEVVDGLMKVGKKYRGNFEFVILKYVEDRLSGRDDIDISRVFITHPACPPEIVQAVKHKIKEYVKFEEVIELRAGCSVAIHSGPITLGIIFKRKA